MSAETAIKQAYAGTHNIWTVAMRFNMTWAEVAYILGFIGKAEMMAYGKRGV